MYVYLILTYFNTTWIQKKGEKLPHPFLGMGETNSYLDIPPPFFFSGAAIPFFFEPSQFVSWSAQPLEPIRET